jgi:hypothetical protein
MIVRILIATVLCGLPAISSAQPPAAPIPPQAPPRDAVAAAAVIGSAAIRGRVVDLQSGLPLRGVTISARMDANRGQTTLTDGKGQYEIAALPAGRYAVTARTDGYLTLSFGQTRPNQTAAPLPLRDRQIVENVDFKLPRGGVIAGVVRDEQNEPVAGHQVRILSSSYGEGRRQLTLVGDIQITNDLGEFRVFGIPPGSFYVAAVTPISTASPESAGASFAPTYFPDTVNLSEARRVNLKIGEVVNNIDIALHAVELGAINATVLDQDGRTLSSPLLNVRYIASGVSPALSIPRVEPNGTFTVTSLPPGDYELQVTGLSLEKVPLVATSMVTVNGGAAQNVRLTATKMAVISGRLVADDSIRPLISSVSVTVADMAESLAYQSRSLRLATPAKIQPDFTFSVSTAFHRGVLQVPSLPRGWFLQAIRLNGVDVTDTGIEVPEGGTVPGVEVVLTERATELSGIVRGPDNQNVDDYTVLVFARDPMRRRGLTRYFASARPDATARFVIRGLPAGEFYAIALEWADANTFADPEFLEPLAANATPFSLTDGEVRPLDLRLTK